VSRIQLTRAFLWLATFAWAIGLGAKIFDLVVLAAAWGASPPASLKLYPYGHAWPINPGTFFQPLSAILLIASAGALISGWKTTPNLKRWLWLPVIALTLIWIATPTIFWPMINDLYAVAHGKITRSDPEVQAIVHKWFVGDWLRIVAIAAGFFGSVKTLIAAEATG
jgi:hypothetical protein